MQYLSLGVLRHVFGLGMRLAYSSIQSNPCNSVQLATRPFLFALLSSETSLDDLVWFRYGVRNHSGQEKKTPNSPCIFHVVYVCDRRGKGKLCLSCLWASVRVGTLDSGSPTLSKALNRCLRLQICCADFTARLQRFHLLIHPKEMHSSKSSVNWPHYLLIQSWSWCSQWR